MRKFSLLLSLLVMVAMVLAACGAEETSTTVPGTNVPPITAESTSTDDGAATEPAGTVDPNATAAGVPVTGEDSSSRMTNLLDFDVWNQEGEQIGEVEDMVLDFDTSMIAYVIVGTGGFLEIGEKEVLVPWKSMQLHPAGDQQNAFILLTDQEAFNNAPDIDVNSVMPTMGQPAADWDTDIRNYWETGALPSTPSADAAATASPEATATTGTDQVQGGGPVQGVMLASDVLGANITIGGSQGQGNGTGGATGQATATQDAGAAGMATATAGTGAGTDMGADQNVNATIDDMIVDPDTGEIMFLVIDAALTEGQRWIPVPLGALQWDAGNNSFVVKANANALQNAPFFEEGQYPDTATQGWDDEFNTFWQNNP